MNWKFWEKEQKSAQLHNDKVFEAGLRNSLTDVIMGDTNQGVQLSQTDTLFKNNRWYLVSNMRQLLSEIYVEIGLIQTIVDIPVDDGLRGGMTFKSQQIDEDELKLLQNKMDRENDVGIAGFGEKWNRLFGGGGIVIITDQDPSTPLDITALHNTDKLEFRDVDMWELFWSRQNTSDYAASIDSADVLDPEYYDYYGVQLHNSRVIKLTGLRPPSFVRPRLRGWGVSIVETLVRSINQYLKATDLGFEVLDEFKLDVYLLKNLVSTLLQPNGTNKVKERVQLANFQKNFQHAIVLDSEDQYQQKQLSFAGLAEAMAGIRMQVASDMRMPMSKLFGTGSSGFSSGEDDIENYNCMVESQVRGKLKWVILRMGELRCQQIFGYIPDDLEGEFKPLRTLSSEQEENVKSQQFNRLQAAKTAGDVTPKEYREAINKANLLPIKLDTAGVDDELPDPDTIEAAKTTVAPKSTLVPKPAPEAKT